MPATSSSATIDPGINLPNDDRQNDGMRNAVNVHSVLRTTDHGNALYALHCNNWDACFEGVLVGGMAKHLFRGEAAAGAQVTPKDDTVEAEAAASESGLQEARQRTIPHACDVFGEFGREGGDPCWSSSATTEQHCVSVRRLKTMCHFHSPRISDFVIQ